MEPKRVFVDTSAFYALMDRSDRNHSKAALLWKHLLQEEYYLLTSNY
ncbi:MAG: hypothetical protein JRH18_09280 [Deltaproteobacteria bacterium]|nr:hypothetical protein [Deltaproteobacteria bacterium]MBW1962316.1 hypothetical protein [Deltaproteobacteria bacterium]MBW1993912.1 hypothetical protein [Deltaproteobacteria bacterium]MBW2151844.1 hypothetical protein [Deltaproteobacteria bacterium]